MQVSMLYGDLMDYVLTRAVLWLLHTIFIPWVYLLLNKKKYFFYRSPFFPQNQPKYLIINMIHLNSTCTVYGHPWDTVFIIIFADKNSIKKLLKLLFRSSYTRQSMSPMPDFRRLDYLKTLSVSMVENKINGSQSRRVWEITVASCTKGLSVPRKTVIAG